MEVRIKKLKNQKIQHMFLNTWKPGGCLPSSTDYTRSVPRESKHKPDDGTLLTSIVETTTTLVGSCARTMCMVNIQVPSAVTSQGNARVRLLLCIIDSDAGILHCAGEVNKKINFLIKGAGLATTTAKKKE